MPLLEIAGMKHIGQNKLKKYVSLPAHHNSEANIDPVKELQCVVFRQSNIRFFSLHTTTYTSFTNSFTWLYPSLSYNLRPPT